MINKYNKEVDTARVQHLTDMVTKLHTGEVGTEAEVNASLASIDKIVTENPKLLADDYTSYGSEDIYELFTSLVETNNIEITSGMVTSSVDKIIYSLISKIKALNGAIDKLKVDLKEARNDLSEAGVEKIVEISSTIDNFTELRSNLMANKKVFIKHPERFTESIMELVTLIKVVDVVKLDTIKEVLEKLDYDGSEAGHIKFITRQDFLDFDLIARDVFLGGNEVSAKLFKTIDESELFSTKFPEVTAELNALRVNNGTYTIQQVYTIFEKFKEINLSSMSNDECKYDVLTTELVEAMNNLGSLYGVVQMLNADEINSVLMDTVTTNKEGHISLLKASIQTMKKRLAKREEPICEDEVVYRAVFMVVLIYSLYGSMTALNKGSLVNNML